LISFIQKFFTWFATGGIAWITFSKTSRPRRFLRSMLYKFNIFLKTKPKLKARIIKIFFFVPDYIFSRTKDVAPIEPNINNINILNKRALQIFGEFRLQYSKNSSL
jgi:hypothetical protein